MIVTLFAWVRKYRRITVNQAFKIYMTRKKILTGSDKIHATDVRYIQEMFPHLSFDDIFMRYVEYLEDHE